jgi:beta-glucosidase
MRIQLLLPVITFFTFFGQISGQPPAIPVYKNPDKGIEERVEDLLSRMTLEEKINMVSGSKNDDANYATDTDQGLDSPSTIIRALSFQSRTRRNVRLGIPQFIMTDGPLGPNGKGGSTNYSSSINFAATFDDSLIHKVAQSIGAETRNLGYNMLLAPCINIARAPHNGRTFESFGEDPYLMSRMGVAFVRGVQSQRVATCTKHYIANNQEWNRMSVDANMDERTLREIYLPAFKAIVQEADGWTIMSAYNKTLGHYCAENKYLLQDILKDDLGFTGVVVSDWGGVHNTVPTTLAGLDLEMPTGRFLSSELLLPEINSGTVPASLIDDKVSRIFRVMFKAGLFDESVASYGGQTDTEYRRKLALEVAEKSIVLLKNQDNFLPLKKDDYNKVAVLGPNGDIARVAGGGSGGNNGHYAISPFEGIKNKYGECSDVQFQRGIAVSKLELPVVPASMLELPEDKGKGNGVWAEYFNNIDLDGEPALTRKEDQINFDWGYGEFRDPAEKGSPDPDIIQTDRWSARWTGKLSSPGEGWYDIGLKADNGVRLYLNNQLIIDAWTDQAPGRYKIAQFHFEKDKMYDLKVEFYENWGSCRCILGLEEFKQSPATDDAIELAKESDLVVMCMGLNADMEGEAKDRDNLSLPAAQIDLIKSIAMVNSNVIVVLFGATPIIMNSWKDDVPVIIDALYPGQEGGNALANIIFGDVSPSAKLPLTFLKNWKDSPVHGTYPGPRDSAEYSEGLFMGYRHYDKFDIDPLFPFGFGLSYTTFEFSDLILSQNSITEDDSLMVEVTLRNSGEMKGDEIVQLYISDKIASVEREVKSLKGFARVSLDPGESKSVRFKVDKSHLSFYDVNSGSWIVEPGEFEILVGNSSTNILSKDVFTIK